MSFSSTNINTHNSNNNDNMTNSSLDFVSADVNEMLQDAQQILANREQRRDGQHPNERVLDKSTTVRVTKQGGDEDPMEVTVLRKEAETEDPGNEEDGVQLKVEITEQCRQQAGKGTHFVEQMIAVMGLATIAVSLWDKFKDKLYRTLRAGIFSCMGLSDLPRPRHRKLAAELDREIFLFLTPVAQHKFIWGLNWDFYAMFRYRLLTKTKRVRNPHGNRWENTNTLATIAADGLNVSITNGFSNVLTEQPFHISGPLCRADDFPGTILYYYEVKGDMCFVGLSCAITDNSWIGGYSNSYAIPIHSGHHCHVCRLAGELHRFELAGGAIRPEIKQFGNVYGCGLILDPQDKLTIFFTLNGKLLGWKVPISPTVDCLFPAVSVWEESSVEANFGDDPAKPFEYDIHKCPGLGLTCI